MKKLFVLTLVLMLATVAMGRDSLEVWVGGEFTDPVDAATWLDVMTVSPDKYVDIPVYLRAQTDSVFVADMCYPLGCQLIYVDEINDGTINFPFSTWDIKQYGNANDEFGGGAGGPCPAGWISLSFLGFARPVTVTPSWFPENPGDAGPTAYPNIVNGFSFTVHTINDTLLIGDTICDAFGPGVDYVQGPANAGDTLGGAGYKLIQHFGCLYFSPNQPPIIDYTETFEMPYLCGYTNFEVTFDVFDNDGDDLVVTINYGTIIGMEVIYGVPGEPSLYEYTVEFNMDDFCGDCWVFDIYITAYDGVNDMVEEYFYGPFTIIGELVADIGDADIWPGEEEWLPVNLDVCGNCFCLGGFVFSICFDASVLEVTDVMLGAALAGAEYWNVTYPAPGVVHFVLINDLNNCETPPAICGEAFDDPIFFVKFLLDGATYYPTGFCIPVCFCIEGDYTDNNVSDADGFSFLPIPCEELPPDSALVGISHLELECGEIVVLDEHNIVYGDVNLNGYPFESGDVVTLANHLGDPGAYPFSLRQMIASDVNGDGLRATIADLIFMLNMLNGFSGPKLAPIDVLATVSMPEDASGNVNVMINSETSVGGAVVTINHTGIELGEPFVEGMDLNYSDNGDVMTVVVYNMEAIPFAAGSNVLFTVPVLGEGELTFGDVSISDNRGALLDARSELSAPIPTEFTVSQNFPNPFNANTRINFTVPADANVNIAVYNVAGQLVENMDLGNVNAGYKTVVWDASDVASGVYFYKVNVGDQSETMKMTLLK